MGTYAICTMSPRRYMYIPYCSNISWSCFFVLIEFVVLFSADSLTELEVSLYQLVFLLVMHEIVIIVQIEW